MHHKDFELKSVPEVRFCWNVVVFAAKTLHRQPKPCVFWHCSLLHSWKHNVCGIDCDVFLWASLLHFRDSDHGVWTVAVVIWVKGLELAQIIWHYLSNCWLGLAQIIWHYATLRNWTIWIQQSLIMSWWRKKRRNLCDLGVLGYLS